MASLFSEAGDRLLNRLRENAVSTPLHEALGEWVTSVEEKLAIARGRLARLESPGKPRDLIQEKLDELAGHVSSGKALDLVIEKQLGKLIQIQNDTTRMITGLALCLDKNDERQNQIGSQMMKASCDLVFSLERLKRCILKESK